MSGNYLGSGKYLGMPAVLAAICSDAARSSLAGGGSRAHSRQPAGQLAERAGIPLTLTHAEAARAIAYIRVMVSDDPEVARCRVALRGR